MAKAVLISIRPKWVEKILRGEKTVEVRKTCPKIETPFKCYIYCTMPNAKDPHQLLEIHSADGKIRKANGKVTGEFVCNGITQLHNVCTDDWTRLIGSANSLEKKIADMACLTEMQLRTYAGGRNCFAWHISDVLVYDTPRELAEFERPYDCDRCDDAKWGSDCNECFAEHKVHRPPQSWCYVEELERGADNG